MMRHCRWFIFFILLFRGSLPIVLAQDTHQTLPSATSSTFNTTLQNFLRVEDANRTADTTAHLGWVVLDGGCLAADSGSKVLAPFACSAYTANGYYATQASTGIDLGASPGPACTNDDLAWVIMTDGLTSPGGNFLQVGTSQYWVDCTSATLPATPSNATMLFAVRIVSGASTVLDLRPTAPGLPGRHASHAVWTLAAEQRAVDAEMSQSYVVSGCVHGTDADTTVSIASCQALIRDSQSPAQLQVAREPLAQTISYTAGNGLYWLILRANIGTDPATWTCTAATHYCWQLAAAQPTLPSGTTWLAQVTVAGGAITQVRRLFNTNGTLPAMISATDPIIGMVCDGVTDESAKLQLALDIASERGGTTVLLPAGTCVVKVQIRQFTLALDTNQYGRGCASLHGQGIDYTTLVAPSNITAAEFVIDLYCPGLGGRSDGGTAGANRGGGATIRDLTVAGRIGRTIEHHGIRFDGGDIHLETVGFRWINGHGLKMCHANVTREVTLNNLIFRHTGRIVAEGGSTNNEAMLIGIHGGADPECNNIYINNLLMVYPWFGGFAIKSSAAHTNRAIFLNNAMFHGHEAVTATKQGRIADESALLHVDGPGFNFAFTNLFINSPGSDNADTDSLTNPSPGILLSDSTGSSGPNNVNIASSIGVQSVTGYFLKITMARRVTLVGSTVTASQFPAGHLDVASAGVTQLNVSSFIADTGKVNIKYGDRALINDNQYTLQWQVTTDLDRDGTHSEALETLGETGIFEGPRTLCNIHDLQYTPFGAVTPGAGDSATFTFRIRGGGQNTTFATLTVNSTNPLVAYTPHVATFASSVFPISAAATELRFLTPDFMSLQVAKGGAGVALPAGLVTLRCAQSLAVETP